MKVDRAKAIRLQHFDHTYYFCSEHCRAQFEANPDAYLRRASGEAHEPAHAR